MRCGNPIKRKSLKCSQEELTGDKVSYILPLSLFFLQSFIYNLSFSQAHIDSHYNVEKKKTPPKNSDQQIFIKKGTCKNPFLIYIVENEFYDPSFHFDQEVEGEPWIKVHGNVSYDYTYRSYVDSPFAQAGLSQHFVQANLAITLKNKYPVHLVLSNRFSNSPYFKDITDFGFRYDRTQLVSTIKKKLLSKMSNNSASGQLNLLKAEVESLNFGASKLKNWIDDPAREQEIIEEKENRIKLKTEENQKRVIGEVKEMTGVEKRLEEKRKELYELTVLIKSKRDSLNVLKKLYADSLSQERTKITSLRNSAQLRSYLVERGIPGDSISFMEKALLSVSKISLGRTFLDYSELTVKNITLTGFDVEVNPGNIYLALSAGRVNYRFRDFVFKDDNRKNRQNLLLVRAGLGKIEKNNIILTYYNGRKSLSMFSSGFQGLERVSGFSLETKLSIDENNYIIAEVAKSNFFKPGIQSQNPQSSKEIFNFQDHTNEAYSIKVNSYLPLSKTKLAASYKKMGENFQSFNLYPRQVNTSAWMVKFNQSIWKGKMKIDAGLRKNDWTSSIAFPSMIETEVVFLSLQASLQLKKLPYVSVGYYPTSQLSLTNNNTLIESMYNTFNIITNYNYHLGSMQMNTSGVFTRFYNKSRDTGFAFFNAKSYNLSHVIYFARWNCQTGISLTKHSLIELFTLEELLNFQLNERVMLKGGLKWSRYNKRENLLGETVGIGISLGKYGSIQLMYDKAFLPGLNRTLNKVETGKVALYKSF